MAELPESIVLGAEEEASRLWQGALAAIEQADRSLVSLCESLDLGLRTAEILAIRRLQRVQHDFPATIAHQLETPVPEVDAYRDAVTLPRSLQFTDILDLLSEASLDCSSPRLHRGWEDRAFACKRSRKTAHRVIPIELDDADRDRLLLLAAYRNRIFRLPPPVRIVAGEILPALESLTRLVDGLRSA